MRDMGTYLQKEEERMTVGQRIQQIRGSLGLSQEEFGERLEVTRQTVSKWELDQAIPEVQKIVMISKLFSVTTDSILVDGISTFDTDIWRDSFVCGVYRGENCEIVETERFLLVYGNDGRQEHFFARCYKGFLERKKLCAVCERNQPGKETAYAYRTEGMEICSNSGALSEMLGEEFDRQQLKGMKRQYTFIINHEKEKLPAVSEAGVKKCLQSWRLGVKYAADPRQFSVNCVTDRTEYIFSIAPDRVNIYCGAAYNIPFELGMFGGGQYFRFRNLGENEEKWCGFYSNFNMQQPQVEIPVSECRTGECVLTSKGYIWSLKRYTDDLIVLQGCGMDEYTYRRDARKEEAFIF